MLHSYQELCKCHWTENLENYKIWTPEMLGRDFIIGLEIAAHSIFHEMITERKLKHT